MPVVDDVDDSELTGPDRGRRRLLGIAAVVLALVVGLVVGFVVGGGTSRDSSVASVATSPEPSPTVLPRPTPSDVPRACAQAGAAGAAVLAQLQLAVQAITALDPAALRQIVDRLKPLQADLEAAVAGCGVP